MSSEQFENNEDDLKTLLTSLNSRVDSRLPRLFGEERKSAVRECEREIDEAEALAKEMREEAVVAPPQYRGQMMSKVCDSIHENGHGHHLCTACTNCARTYVHLHACIMLIQQTRKTQLKSTRAYRHLYITITTRPIFFRGFCNYNAFQPGIRFVFVCSFQRCMS